MGAPEAPAPSTGFHWLGGRGLSQTKSADALGSGVFLVGLRGATNPTSYDIPEETPPHGAMVTNVVGSAGFGVNSFIDFSAWSSYYTVSKWTQNPNSSGFGASGVSAKIGIPFASDFPLRLAVQGGVIAGASNQQLHVGYDDVRGAYRPDGYTYFENRNGYDFEGRFLQTLRFGKDVIFEMHANEGLVSTLQADHAMLTVLDGGMALTPWPFLTIGIEGHVRTLALKPRPFTDPLWGTIDLAFHIPRGPDLAIGADFAVSQSRSDVYGSHALDPWRVFFQAAMPFDLGAEARTRQQALEEKNAKERADLEKRAKELEALAAQNEARAAALKAQTDSLLAKMRQDSIANAQMGSAYRRRNDSLAALALQDSLRRVAAEKALAEERARSNSLENALLNTGIVALDAVYFANNKSILTPNSKPYLKLVGGILAKYPKLRLEIGGHTDNRGKPSANKRLSLLRAQSVRTYLVTQYPILSSSLKAKGYGSDAPLADNGTAEGREQNRRVEIKVTNPEILESLRSSR